VLLGLLPGYYFCMASFAWWASFPGVTGLDPSDSMVLVGILCVLVSFSRIFVYLVGYFPPISTMGRVFTGRLIVPGYDVIFLAPLISVVTALALMAWMKDQGFGGGAVAASGMTVFFLIILNSGPSLSKWRLTGSHRLVPTARNVTRV
jgi:hypothetical protein